MTYPKTVVAALCVALCTTMACGASQQRIDTLEARVQELERYQKERAATDERMAALEAQLQTLQESTSSLGEQLAQFAEVAGVFRNLLEMQADRGNDEPDTSVVHAVPVDGSPFEGPADAKVTIVEAFEFACPFCERARPTLRQIRERYGKDVRIVYKHFLVHTDVAEVPARAVCAAHAQGKFSPMKEAVWDQGFLDGRKLSADDMRRIARKVGLNMRRFERDMNGDECGQRVRGDHAMLAGLGVQGTPTFFINGRIVIGAQPLDAFTQVIDEELAKADEAIRTQGIKQGEYYDHVVKSGQQGR